MLFQTQQVSYHAHTPDCLSRLRVSSHDEFMTRLYLTRVVVASVTVSGHGDPGDQGGRHAAFVEFWA